MLEAPPRRLPVEMARGRGLAMDERCGLPEASSTVGLGHGDGEVPASGDVWLDGVESEGGVLGDPPDALLLIDIMPVL